jgi:hypothetical protein
MNTSVKECTNDANLRTLYLELLKAALLGKLIEDKPVVSSSQPTSGIYNFVTNFFKPKRFDPEVRAGGLDWPSIAHTMIGEKRLNNLQQCVEDVLASNVPGDFIETGVWRGGATIFMRGMLKAYGVTDRHVWVADSFEGLPKPNAKKYPADRWLKFDWFKTLSVSLEQVRTNFEKYGLLDDQVHFLKGWFKDTLPSAPIQKLAVLRLDGDLYESTMDALTSLYPKLSVGGYLIVDDYIIPACKKAVTDYRNAHGITDLIIDIDRTGSYWQRTHA